jgi:hypothetical protein
VVREIFMDEEKDKEKSNLSDILKKVVNTGISAAFMTEDAVKGMLSDLPLPKEMVSGLLANAKGTRDEFISSVKTELKTYLDKIDISKEVDRVLDNYDLDIQANIKFNKKKKSVSKTPKKSKE